jgi:hypothetical protein
LIVAGSSSAGERADERADERTSPAAPITAWRAADERADERALRGLGAAGDRPSVEGSSGAPAAPSDERSALLSSGD